MNKSEVYSWRLSPDLKLALEDAARAEKSSIGTLLERITREWLRTHKSPHDEAEQERRRAAFLAIVESVSDDPEYASDSYSKEKLGERVIARVGRNLSHEKPD